MSIRSEAKPDSKPAPPVHKERLGSVEAAVWKNEVGEEGKTRLRVTLSKSYKDADGEWQRTGSLDAEDLPFAVKVLDRCHTWAAEQRYTHAKVAIEDIKQEEREEEQERTR